jgi:hypothetical protein
MANAGPIASAEGGRIAGAIAGGAGGGATNTGLGGTSGRKVVIIVIEEAMT